MIVSEMGIVGPCRKIGSTVLARNTQLNPWEWHGVHQQHAGFCVGFYAGGGILSKDMCVKTEVVEITPF